MLKPPPPNPSELCKRLAYQPHPFLFNCGENSKRQCLSHYWLLWQNTIDWGTYTTKVYFSVLEAGGPRSGCQHGQVLVRALFLFMSSHGLPWSVHTERSFVPSSFYKDLNPIMKPSSSWPNIILIISQRLSLQIPSHWGLGFQPLSFGGHKDSVHSNEYLKNTD